MRDSSPAPPSTAEDVRLLKERRRLSDALDTEPKHDPKDGHLIYSKLQLREWERSLAWRDADFARDEKAHPHILRRSTILAAHPLVRRLYGKDPTTAWVIALGVANHMLLAWMLGRTEGTLGWVKIVLAALFFGSTIGDLMSICIHECVHALVAPTSLANKLLALLANVGTPFPIAMSFRRYHSDHHVYQGKHRPPPPPSPPILGTESKDPDLPLPWELRLIKGDTLTKLVWLTIYPVMYAVRALVRGGTVTRWEAINTAFTLLCDLLIFLLLGPRALAYVLLSFFFGYTFHPVAAHFLQEHYTFEDGQETYNYYGWANSYFLNIGFHNEHHDFPGIPGKHLPLVTLLAPEYYQPLKAHKSWRKVLWSFLTDSNIGPQSRCVRQ